MFGYFASPIDAKILSEREHSFIESVGYSQLLIKNHFFKQALRVFGK